MNKVLTAPGLFLFAHKVPKQQMSPGSGGYQ